MERRPRHELTIKGGLEAVSHFREGWSTTQVYHTFPCRTLSFANNFCSICEKLGKVKNRHKCSLMKLGYCTMLGLHYWLACINYLPWEQNFVRYHSAMLCSRLRWCSANCLYNAGHSQSLEKRLFWLPSSPILRWMLAFFIQSIIWQLHDVIHRAD